MAKRKPIQQQISELDARRQTLVARMRKQERTKDTRRKILLGALVMNRLSQKNKFSEGLQNWLRADLPKYLTRQSDLALFDDILSVADSTGNNSENKQA